MIFFHCLARFQALHSFTYLFVTTPAILLSQPTSSLFPLVTGVGYIES